MGVVYTFRKNSYSILGEACTRLPLHKQAAFSNAVAQASELQSKRSLALAQGREEASKYQQALDADLASQRQRATSQARDAFNQVRSSEFADNPIFQGPDAASRIAKAEAILFGQNDPAALSRAALNAVYAQEVQPLLVKAYDEITRLTAALDKTASHSAPSQSKGPAPSSNQNQNSESFSDKVLRRSRELSESRR
jgi:hypothetical protein